MWLPRSQWLFTDTEAWNDKLEHTVSHFLMAECTFEEGYLPECVQSTVNLVVYQSRKHLEFDHQID